jgi:hypothetical protein
VEGVSLILICMGTLVCKVFVLSVIVLIISHVVLRLLSDCDISLLQRNLLAVVITLDNI